MKCKDCPCHKKEDGTLLRSCMTPEEINLSNDIYNMAKAIREDLGKHVRPAMNGWLQEDYEEWGHQVNTCYKRLWQSGQICQEAYQDIMCMVWEVGGRLTQEIQEYEEQEEYVQGLTGNYSDN